MFLKLIPLYAQNEHEKGIQTVAWPQCTIMLLSDTITVVPLKTFLE